MAKRTVRLTKDGHDYVFSYAPGSEGQAVDEIMQLAADEEAGFDWMDAASLGFQIAQNAAVDCCAEIMSPSHVSRDSHKPSGAEHGIGGDDAQDGPCTNHNLP